MSPHIVAGPMRFTHDPSSVLLGLSLAAQTDTDAASVLLDALLVDPQSWSDARVIMLCVGVPLGEHPPDNLGERGRKTWRARRSKSISFALSVWDRYVGRLDFERAVTAAVLFGGWPPAGVVTPAGTRSPWELVRAQYRTSSWYLASVARRRARRSMWGAGLASVEQRVEADIAEQIAKAHARLGSSSSSGS